jgi:fatty acid desaturase
MEMVSAAWHHPRTRIWRFSASDSIMVALAALQAVILALWPVTPLIAVGMWWNSNTIAHNFVHRPFFRSGAMNSIFSAFLSVLLGIPQTLWRDRHLAHHADVEWLKPSIYATSQRRKPELVSDLNQTYFGCFVLLGHALALRLAAQYFFMRAD